MQSVFLTIILCFQLCGMCPIAIELRNWKQTTHLNVMLVCWSLVQMFALVCSTTSLFVFYDQVFEKHATIGQFNDLAKFACISLTHITLIVESLAARKNQLCIWQKLNDVDELFDKMGTNTAVANQRMYKWYSFKFLVCIACTLLVEFRIISGIQDDRPWTKFWMASFVSLLFSRIKHLQHTLYIDLMAYRFQNLHVELQKVVFTSKNDRKSLKEEMYTKRLFVKVKLIKNIYNVLWEVSNHLNSCFGLAQLSNLMQNFVQLTCDLYWIYSVLYKNDLTNILELILNLVPTFLIVNVLFYSCEQCLREIRFIGYLLHNVEKDLDNYEFDTLIESFSLQVLHEPFCFSVSGFFDMDFTLLKAMVAAITTYMVIFIQFMPKEEVPPMVNSTLVENVTALAVVT